MYTTGSNSLFQKGIHLQISLYLYSNRNNPSVSWHFSRSLRKGRCAELPPNGSFQPYPPSDFIIKPSGSLGMVIKGEVIHDIRIRAWLHLKLSKVCYKK